MKSNKRKFKSKKVGVAPFVAGAAVGTVAGLLLAKKPGDELFENIEDNLGNIKDKAKDAYENKDEIIDKVSRNIKSFTNTEIKNFVEPEYYSKEFDLDEEDVKEKIVETKEKVEDLAENAAEDFEDKIKDAKKESKEFIDDAAKNIQKGTKKAKNKAKDVVEDAADKAEELVDKISE